MLTSFLILIIVLTCILIILVANTHSLRMGSRYSSGTIHMSELLKEHVGEGIKSGDNLF